MNLDFSTSFLKKFQRLENVYEIKNKAEKSDGIADYFFWFWIVFELFEIFGKACKILKTHSCVVHRSINAKSKDGHWVEKFRINLKKVNKTIENVSIIVVNSDASLAY